MLDQIIYRQDVNGVKEIKAFIKQNPKNWVEQVWQMLSNYRSTVTQDTAGCCRVCTVAHKTQNLQVIHYDNN